MTSSAVDLVQEARRLDGDARRHKGEITRHRRALQSVRERQAEIERQCAALGITVTYHPPSPRSGQRPTA